MSRNHLCVNPGRQRGAGLPIALFIVTVLSLLVLGMAQLQDSSARAVSLQIQSQRAFFAAESGAQLTLAQIVPGTEGAQEVCEQSYEPEIAFNVAGLSGCQADISVECIRSGAASDPADLVIIESTGSCGADAERTLKVKVR